MRQISKRQFMRKPSILSGLQAGESVTIAGRPPLVVSRPKEGELTAQQMEAQLDKLAAKCPKIDTLRILKDLRK